MKNRIHCDNTKCRRCKNTQSLSNSGSVGYGKVSNNKDNINSMVRVLYNKKFWEELIAYFP
jgi:hypothetical protein